MRIRIFNEVRIKLILNEYGKKTAEGWFSFRTTAPIPTHPHACVPCRAVPRMEDVSSCDF